MWNSHSSLPVLVGCCKVDHVVAILDWKQINRRNGRENTSYNSFKIHLKLERCGHKKTNKPKDNLFWSQIGSDIRGGGPKRAMSSWQDGDVGSGWGGMRRLGVPSKPSCGASATVPQGKHPGCAWGGTCWFTYGGPQNSHWDLTRTREIVTRSFMQWMHSLSVSPLTPAGLWWRQALVTLTCPFAIKSSNTSCSISDQTVRVSMQTFWILSLAFMSALQTVRMLLLQGFPRSFFAWGRSMGCSQCCGPQMLSGLGRRLGMVLDMSSVCHCQQGSKVSLGGKISLWENESMEQSAAGATVGPATLWHLHGAVFCWGWSVCLLECFQQSGWRFCVRVVGFCTHRSCWKCYSNEEKNHSGMITNVIFTWRKVHLVPVGWGLGWAR